MLGRAAYWHRTGSGASVSATCEARPTTWAGFQAYIDLGLMADAAALTPYWAVLIELGRDDPTLAWRFSTMVSGWRPGARGGLRRIDIPSRGSDGARPPRRIDVTSRGAYDRRRLGDRPMLVYAHWVGMISCSCAATPRHTGHARGTEAATANGGAGRADFLADAADCWIGSATPRSPGSICAGQRTPGMRSRDRDGGVRTLARHGDPELGAGAARRGAQPAGSRRASTGV